MDLEDRERDRIAWGVPSPRRLEARASDGHPQERDPDRDPPEPEPAG